MLGAHYGIGTIRTRQTTRLTAGAFVTRNINIRLEYNQILLGVVNEIYYSNSYNFNTFY